MTIELIGLLSFAIGLLVVYRGPDFGIYALMFACLLGAAAALKLPALGDANILPLSVIMPFYAIAVFRSPGAVGDALHSFGFPSPRFWYALFVAYCVLTAIFLPRIFEGAIEVLSIARGESGQAIIGSPLGPRGSNVTQAGYLIGNVVFLAAISAHVMRGGLETIVRAVLAAAALNIAFAIADIVTYSTGTGALLEVIRNANYAMQVDVDIGGVKRIVGSFTEASAFGAITLIFLAFTTELWLGGVHSRVSGWLAFLSLVALLLATSSSAYVGLVAYALVLSLRCLWAILAGRASPREVLIASVVPLCGLLLLTALMMNPSAWKVLVDMVDATLLNKLNTQSGLERSFWNEDGMRVFYETGMMGAGVGSVRTSSIAVALLANTGVIGFALMIAFLGSLVFSAARGATSDVEAAYARAGAWACFVMLVSALLAAASVDLGLLFLIGATIVCGSELRSRSSDVRRYVPTLMRREQLREA